MTKKIKNRVKVFLTLFLIAFFLLIHFFVPRVITEIRNPIIQAAKGEYAITTKPSFSIDPDVGQEIRFRSFDNTEIVAYETYSKLDTTLSTIILLHGIRSDKEHFISFSNYLANQAFDVVAVDLRAHGASGGSNCTFGVSEKMDITMLIDVLQSKEPNRTIGIFGQSLGGAVALQSLGYDHRLSFGVIESTFSEFRTVTHDYCKFHGGIAIKFVSDYLVDRAASLAGFDPDDASPIKYCKQITQPVLMVHGTDDQRIDIKYGKANFAALRNNSSQFLEVEGANHINVWTIGGKDYMNEILSFMKDVSN